MKRNMELIRLLLMDVEGEEDVDLSPYSDEEILYHKSLLVDSGLVVGKVLRGEQYEVVAVDITQLSWEGHDFLDAARNEKVWRKVQEKIASFGGSVTMTVLKQLLKNEIATQFGL